MASDSERGTGPRLIVLLRLIAEEARSFSLKEISERADLPPSTAHRLLQVLTRSGLVERGPHQTYGPGRELYRMASLLRGRFDLSRTARPFLERLWSQWQETAVLCLYNPTSRTGTVVDAGPDDASAPVRGRDRHGVGFALGLARAGDARFPVARGNRNGARRRDDRPAERPAAGAPRRNIRPISTEFAPTASPTISIPITTSPASPRPCSAPAGR